MSVVEADGHTLLMKLATYDAILVWYPFMFDHERGSRNVNKDLVYELRKDANELIKAPR